jgi:hypothetical protein
MSRRNKRKPASETPEAPRRRPLLVLSKRRFALAALAGLLTMLFMAILGGRVPPRITLVNQTGEPLADIRIEYPGGSIQAGDLPAGEKASFLLRPDPDAPPKPGKAVLITWKLGNGLPGRFFSVAHGQEFGAHDVLAISRLPDGSVTVMPNPSSGWNFSVRAMLRRVGIRL